MALALVTALGACAGWLLTRSVVRPLGVAVAVAHKVAAGDLTSAIAVDGRDEPARLLEALRTMQGNLESVVANVRSNAEGVASASAEIAQGNADLSQRTEQQASSLDETASSMQQLQATVQQNTAHAQRANALARNGATVAQRGGAVVTQMVEVVQGIQESSRRIADIIGVIDSIAFQTNILALNAAVEAARAGEQGRGFAVVAEEVRRLALRSGEAAKDIRRQIDRSVQAVAQGAALSGQVQSVMQGFESRIGEVAERMQDIAQAAVQQHEGIAQISDAIGQLEQATAQNAELAEQSLATAQMLQAHTQQMEQRAALFVTRAG